MERVAKLLLSHLFNLQPVKLSNPKDIFHTNRTKNSIIYLEPLKTPKSQSNTEKKEQSWPFHYREHHMKGQQVTRVEAPFFLGGGGGRLSKDIIKVTEAERLE